MTFGFPENTVLGRLRMLRVYDFYDGPRLFAAANQVGHTFLCLSVEESPARDAWLYTPISNERLRTLELRAIDVRTAFTIPEADHAYLVSLDLESGQFAADEVAVDAIDPTWLPQDDEFFIDGFEAQTDSDLAPVVDLASQRHRETVRLALAFPGLFPKEAPSRSLGLVLTSFQELTSALAQSVSGEATTRGRIAPDILNASEMRVIDTFAASFGIEMTAATLADLFGDSIAGDALESMDKLIAAGDAADELGALFIDLKPRVVSKYRAFIETLIDSEARLSLEWASPKPDRTATRVLTQEQLRAIAATIALVDSSTSTTAVVRGILIGLNARTRHFEFEDTRNQERISGRLEKDRFPEDHEFTINAVYNATIREEVEVSGLTGDEKVSRILTDLERI